MNGSVQAHVERLDHGSVAAVQTTRHIARE
jgi:hypothetical protein